MDIEVTQVKAEPRPERWEVSGPDRRGIYTVHDGCGNPGFIKVLDYHGKGEERARRVSAVNELLTSTQELLLLLEQNAKAWRIRSDGPAIIRAIAAVAKATGTAQ